LHKPNRHELPQLDIFDTSMKVFIADSSPQLDERLEHLLSELKGLDVVGRSHDVAEALQSIHELKPDVVLLDVHGLGKSGRDLLNTITEDAESPFLMMEAESVAGLYPKQPQAPSSDFLLYKTADLGKALASIEGLLLHLQSRQRGNT
jgi:DNA-binding NarL/FixJ family response regulator